MYDLVYVKRKKRRRAVAIASGVSSIGLIAFMIVAFLGKKVGTFTVSISNSNVSLVMDTTVNFTQPRTYIYVDRVPDFTGAYTYNYFEVEKEVTPGVRELVFREDVHDESTNDYKIGAVVNPKTGKIEGLRFFKLTFFIKNVGNVLANYTLDVNILRNNEPTNNTGNTKLDDYLRVMTFEDDETPKVWGKISRNTIPHEDPENPGVLSYSEPVSYIDPADPRFRGYTKEFDSSNNNCARLISSVDVDEVKKYTVLFWLEGEDPECKIKPENASITLGVNINAYE